MYENIFSFFFFLLKNFLDYATSTPSEITKQVRTNVVAQRGSKQLQSENPKS